MNTRQVRQLLEDMINICDQSLASGEMSVRAHDRIDEVREKYESLVEEEF